MKRYSSFDSFSTVKTVKIILGLGIVKKKQAVGQIWSGGSKLLAPGLWIMTCGLCNNLIHVCLSLKLGAPCR